MPITILINVNSLLFEISYPINYQRNTPPSEGNTSKIVNLKAKLSMSEVLVFQLLYSNLNNPVSRDELLQYGWPGKLVTSNSLNVAIRSLRSKMNYDAIKEHIAIKTIPGLGYCLVINNNRINIIFAEECVSTEQLATSSNENVSTSAPHFMNNTVFNRVWLSTASLWMKVSIKMVMLTFIIQAFYSVYG